MRSYLRQPIPRISVSALVWQLLALALFLSSCSSVPEADRLRLSGIWVAELGAEPNPRREQGLPLFPPRLDFHASIAREGKGRLMLDFYDGRSYEIAGLRRLGENEYRLRLSRLRAAEGFPSPRRALLRLLFLDEARAELREEGTVGGLLERAGPLRIRKLLGPGLQ